MTIILDKFVDNPSDDNNADDDQDLLVSRSLFSSSHWTLRRCCSWRRSHSALFLEIIERMMTNMKIIMLTISHFRCSFTLLFLYWWQIWRRLSLSTKSYSDIHVSLPLCSFTLSSYLCFLCHDRLPSPFTLLLITNHQPERRNLKDPQILLRDLQSVDVNLTAQY